MAPRKEKGEKAPADQGGVVSLKSVLECDHID